MSKKPKSFVIDHEKSVSVIREVLKTLDVSHVDFVLHSMSLTNTALSFINLAGLNEPFMDLINSFPEEVRAQIAIVSLVNRRIYEINEIPATGEIPVEFN